MLHLAAMKIACSWVKIGVAAADEVEAYQYGIELILSTSINTILIIAVSAICGHPFAFVPYLITFIPLRLCAGGYHAKSHLACIVFNSAVYFTALELSKHLSGQNAQLFCIAESLLSFLVVLIFAPVQAKNKPLAEGEKRKNRKLAIILSLLALILSVLFACFNLYDSLWCKMLFCGQGTSAVLLLPKQIMSSKS